jgi:hypothetical protein
MRVPFTVLGLPSTSARRTKRRVASTVRATVAQRYGVLAELGTVPERARMYVCMYVFMYIDALCQRLLRDMKTVSHTCACANVCMRALCVYVRIMCH